jgi:hypothetical protein
MNKLVGEGKWRGKVLNNETDAELKNGDEEGWVK